MGDSSDPPQSDRSLPVSSNPSTHVGDHYQVPAYEPHPSLTTLKERIRHHYELASDYYYSLW